MGARRSPAERQGAQEARQERQESSATAEAAAAVAAILVAGGAAATVPAVAGALVPILPALLLRTPELAAQVAEAIGELVLEGAPQFDDRAGGLELRAGMENIIVRGIYAVKATRRIGAAVLANPERPVRERIDAALRAERPYFEAHRTARQRNREAARATEEARERYGDVLTWIHAATREPADPRPNHEAADGKQFDLRRGIPASTGALPGVLPWCSCAWGPPRRGGEVLV